MVDTGIPAGRSTGVAMADRHTAPGRVYDAARRAGLVLAVLGRRRRLRRRDSSSRPQLIAHQERALAVLRTHAYAHSPFYRRFHAGRLDAPLSELPVLTKAQLMEEFDEAVTDRAVRLDAVERHLAVLRGDELFRGRYRVCATAGTTGRRGIFLWDRSEWVDVLASYNRAQEWGGARAGLTRRMTTAVVSSTNPTHQSARVGASIDSAWLPTVRIDSGDDLASIVLRLNRRQPRTLVAYASMLRVLAEEQIAGRLAIAPEFVFSASEVLTRSTRDAATAAWGRQPRDVYAATETAAIAAECGQHPGMHLFEDLVFTEVVDEANRPVPPGVYGAKVLVTVLFSRTLPLIRYEMTDSIQVAAEHNCPCGRPFGLLAGVQGRAQEALQFATAGGGERTVQPVVVHHVMDRATSAGWQVVQRPDGLDVLLVRPRNVDPPSLAANLRSAIAAQGVVVPNVRVREVESVPRTALGKAPLITRAKS
jgi:putative adenylate-forming enzyme